MRKYERYLSFSPLTFVANSMATSHEPCPLLLAQFYILHHLVELGFVNLSRVHCLFLPRRADFPCFCKFSTALHEGFVNRFVHVNARSRAWHLHVWTIRRKECTQTYKSWKCLCTVHAPEIESGINWARKISNWTQQCFFSYSMIKLHLSKQWQKMLTSFGNNS